jgi:outer membrane protein OmpA-like peptidoglycan-associated protein
MRAKQSQPKIKKPEPAHQSAVHEAMQVGPELLPFRLGHIGSLNGLPTYGTTRSLRQTAALKMQQQYGNGFVQRLLLPLPITAIQRDCPPDCPRQPERPVPGLPDEVNIQAEDAIKAGNQQTAINLVVGELARQGRINLAELDGGQMRYDTGMSDEGYTKSFWDKDPATHPDAKLLPFKITIGPSALASVPWLYVTVIHEWRHVQQFRVPKTIADKNAAHEVDAYLYGIEQAWASGLTTEEVQELWNRLDNDHWSRITDAGIKAALQPRYDAAKAYVESLVASGSVPRVYQRLTFVQIFFATGRAQLDSAANEEVAAMVERANLLRTDHPDYDLRFTFTGFASPRWKHPRRGEIPAELNRALSRQRAENTLAQVQNALRADGDGACDFRIQTCMAQEVTVDDHTCDSLVAGRGAEPALVEGRDLNSDDQQDRRVDVEVELSSGSRVPTKPPAWLGGGGGN